MKKKILFTIIIASMFLLVGCETSQNVTTVQETTETTETTESTEMTDISSNEQEDEYGFTHDEKLEIMAFINGQTDPLYETNMTDEQIEAKCNEVWKDAEEKFGISESDIMHILCDVDITKEYYANESSNSYTTGSSNLTNTVTTYDATLVNSGYKVAVGATKDYVSEFVKYASNNDTTSIENMYNNGFISYVNDGTKVLVKDMGFSISKVKILEGGLKDLEVYVINECIKMK